MTGIAQSMMAGSSGVLKPGATWQSKLVSGSSSTSYITFKANGAIHRTRSGLVDEYIGQWFAPSTPAVGAMYFLYFETIAGSGPFGGAASPPNVGPADGWRPLNADCSCGYSGRTSQMGSWWVHIRVNNGGNPGPVYIVHRADVSIWNS